ncbi:MAG: PP2C family protein-serine/threonine phosphatase [Gammaproteobacteria bacterium]
MKTGSAYSSLMQRVLQALPGMTVYELTTVDGVQHVLGNETDIQLDAPFEVPTNNNHSLYLAIENLPEVLQGLFTDCDDVILSPLQLQPRAHYLLAAAPGKKVMDSYEPQLLLNLVDALVENDRLVKINDRKEKKYQDYIREVKTIKEKLLPSEGHRIEGLDYATYYRPSVGGGGDYFDVIDLRPSRKRAGVENPPLIWGVGLMDVSGHGPGAAVEVAMVDAILRTYEYQAGSGPGDVLKYVNKYYFTREYRGGFSTGILCNYDASTDIFSYASAGHLPILIKHHEGHVSVLQSKTGIPIGIERDYSWTTETTQLEQGDTIVLYTDGITEAESISGEQFGFDRLKSVLEQSPAGSAELLMSNFMDTYHQHVSNSNEQDDQTLVMVTISS